MTVELGAEYKTYLAHQDEFMSNHLDEFVLIKEDKVLGFYGSYKDALSNGLSKCGNVPFFVKVVAKEEEVHFFHQGLA